MRACDSCRLCDNHLPVVGGMWEAGTPPCTTCLCLANCSVGVGRAGATSIGGPARLLNAPRPLLPPQLRNQQDPRHRPGQANARDPRRAVRKRSQPRGVCWHLPAAGVQPSAFENHDPPRSSPKWPHVGTRSSREGHPLQDDCPAAGAAAAGVERRVEADSLP